MKCKKIFTSIVMLGSLSTNLLATNIEDNNISLTETQVGEMATSYFKSHPAKMLEIMQSVKLALKEQKYNGVKKTLISHKAMLLNNIFLPVIGNPKESKTLLFFYDFQCVYCHKEYPFIKQLVQQDKDVKVVFLPLHIFGKASEYATKMALYMSSKNKFQAFYDAVEEGDLIEGKLNNVAVDKIVTNLDINLKDAKEYVESQVADKRIEEIDALKDSLGIQGTPFMFAMPSEAGHLSLKNIEVIRGYVSIDVLKNSLNKVKN
ncbi:DsbA family protein [Francisellaceae bacterium]|nr:DsbA family protein [Francisellaceae bacterium]